MKDGRSARDHVLAGYRRNPSEFAAALASVTPGPVPVAGAVATAAFETLSASRDSGLNGPKAITVMDLQAYSAVLGVPLTPRDARLVLRMDAAYRDEVSAHG
jgi:hypothetical protein